MNQPIRDVVIVDAVRTPFGKRNGGLSGAHTAELLGTVQRSVLERTEVAGDQVDQVVAGCVNQVGMQSVNLGRTAWLTAGLPVSVPARTVEAACGSSQEAANLGYALIASGAADVVLSCGAEVMSRVPIGSTIPKDGSLGKPITQAYRAQLEYTTQFEGAERIASKWGIGRADCDAFGKLSQDRAAAAHRDGRFDSQLLPVRVPLPERPDEVHVVERDECLRETTLEGLAGLKPVGRPDAVHTAGTSSQISDGASAVLMMTREKAAEFGLTPMARIVDTCLIGTDPVLMLTGPIPATRKLLDDNGLQMRDISVVEINEAFASVVLAWERELRPDMAGVNPNGGAIAIGHPLGATGTALITKAIHELPRSDGEFALITMCCGGGMATGTLIQRI